MVEKTVECFNLEQICESGQCFRMMAKGNHIYSIIAGGLYLEAEQKGNRCVFYCEEEEFEQFWKHYFSLDEDYGFYIAQVNEKDRYLKSAVEFGGGIRILQQDLWEVIVSFLISQQNNITRIRRCVNNICESYGEEKINDYGGIYYTFPKPETLAVLKEDDLKECNLGYRSKYVVRTARSVVSGEADLNRISGMSYEEAKEELLKLYGVGEKVAECICLFALH
ncbi:MAG: 8-oxoguanine DNA glycosylase, partial [Lachnospiraceae bacterium]|nr:8-oxoguanine DNA glycosylase [Lachnospiraceae bacterium]